MNIIDTCAYLGHYPFRRVERTTARELCEDMEAQGISRAIVSSLPAVYYRDARDGNLELLSEIEPYRDRLIPAAVVNPLYQEAERDLEHYVRGCGCREIRLFPRQHDYSLTDPRVVAFMKHAAALGVPLSFPLWLEDPRQRAPMDIESALTPAELAAAALAVPEADLILHDSDPYGYACALEPLKEARTGRVYYDLGRGECIYEKRLRATLRLVGDDRLLFATSQPMLYPEAAFIRVAYLPVTAELDNAGVEKILGGNASRLFAL